VGLPTLDRQLGGLSQEEVVVFKAGEKTGKTTLLRQSALETARWLRAHKSPAWVLLYHLEGGWRGWMSGAVTYLAGIERSSLRRGALQGGGHDEEWRQIVAGTTELDELPLRFNTSLRSLSAVSSDVILHQARGMKLCGIWIDYLQKLDVPGLTDTQQVRAASDGLVKLHERTGVPIITASQVTRGEHGTRTYFGAAIQHDASLVLDLERGPKGCRDEHKIHSSREARIMNTLSRYDTCLAPLELTFDGAHARFIEGRPTEYEAPRQDY
jgi:replicative DNA helicase